MELYECEDAVDRALTQRRPKLVVDIINEVRGPLALSLVSLLCFLTPLECGNERDVKQHLAKQHKEKGAAGRPRTLDFVCLDCREDGTCAPFPVLVRLRAPVD